MRFTGVTTEHGADGFRLAQTLRKATGDGGSLLTPAKPTTANDKIVADAMADVDAEFEALCAAELVLV